MTLIPLSVFINPPYNTPQKLQPSVTKAFAVGFIMRLRAKSRSSAVMKGSGEYAPIPPVLGPRSPSKALLWSCAKAIGYTSVPFTKHIKENSCPCINSSIITLSEPNLCTISISCRAASASACVIATTTPLPAARPSYFITIGVPCRST